MQFPSVTGTMNLIMVACNVTGTTIIQNAAREPEVVSLARCLFNVGVKVHGLGRVG